MIESIALEKERVEEGEDTTLPPYDRIKKKLGDLPEAFNTLCGYDATSAAPSAGAKRKPPAGNSATNGAAAASKKAKKAAAAAEEAVVDMNSHVQAGTVKKLKVDELKAYLTSVGESTHGKKKDQLVEAVYDFFKLMK